MQIRLREVLDVQAVRDGDPEVLSGQDSLERPIRWVHVSEVSDVDGLLEGQELILSTGLAMSGSAKDAARYVADLLRAEAAGLVIELSSRFPLVPEEALLVARDADFPVVVLRRKVRFVLITEEVHRRIVADQLANVQFAQEVHETFTRLSLDAAPAQEIVTAAAERCDASLVLEDVNRRVVAFCAIGPGSEGLLEDWERRSRLTPMLRNTGRSGPEYWTTSPVGVQGQTWGRLVLLGGSATVERNDMTLERAAQALELGRMIERDKRGLQVQVNAGFLSALIDGRFATEADARARLQSLGVASGSTFVGLAVQRAGSPSPDGVTAQRQIVSLTDLVSDALGDLPRPSLAGVLSPDQVGILISLAGKSSVDGMVTAFAGAVQEQEPLARIGLGHIAPTLLEAASSIQSAQHIAGVAATMAQPPMTYLRHSDIRLAGLMAHLQADAKVQGFAESELGPLLDHEARHNAGLLELLRQFLSVGGNKTELARISHRNRTALYRRLQKLEQVLGLPLDDPASRLSIGVALMAYDQGRNQPIPRVQPIRSHQG
ncbi:MAG: PucR family transcriptional regulator ligand-binding domain-containing protein [Actinomycetota bacterium]|nr:PucR family transcriptional regulator ligand-binding domain-containing protein [Actinomycetota bacterium]